MSSKPLRLLAHRPLCSPGFTRTLLAEVDIAKKFRPQDILYLTPQKRRARSAEFEILSLYPEEASRPPDCLTLVTLAERLVNARAQKGIVDERDRRFILLKLVHEAKGLVFREEHLGLLSALYSDLKRHYPRNWDRVPDLSKEIIFDTDTAVRLKQAVAVLAVYDEYLAGQDLIDHESLLAEAVNLTDDLPHKLLIIEGYFEPPCAEQELFDALLTRIPETVVILPDDPMAQIGEKFFNRYDFVLQPAPRSQKPPPSIWNTCPSREDEVAAIARRICRLCKEGVNARDIIVVFPRLEIYRPIVDRVFDRYKLCPDISLRPRLESLPAVQAVLDLLRCAEQGFRRRDVVGIILSPFFTNVPDAVRRWVDVLSREEEVISGSGSWTDWFLKKIPYRLRLHSEKDRIVSQIRSFLKDFIKKLKILVKPSSIKGFTEKLENLLEHLGWQVSDNIRLAFDQVLTRLVRMGELANERQVGLRFVTETVEILLRKELPETTQDTISRGIRVMPLVESRWLDAEHVFVGGLVDGEFPRQLKRDYLLPEKLREKLGFLSVEDEFNNDEFEFRRLSAMAKTRVYFTAPTMESDRPLLSSVFLAEREIDPVSDDETVYCEEEQQLLQPEDKKEPSFGVEFVDESSLRMLSDRYTSIYPFHVTSLELYRNCPYRYYLRSVLEIEPYEEPSAEPEAKLLGTVLHDVLFETLRADSDPEKLEDLLTENLIRQLEVRRLNPFVRMWIEEWVKARIDWFVNQETVRQDEGWAVDSKWLEKRLELEFAEGFSVRGRVDRLDWLGERVRVLDYKTGNERYFRLKIKKGESIQLPLYCEMIRRLYKAEIESFAIYSFLDSKMDAFSSPHQEIAAALSYASRAVDGIRKGQFQANDNPLCRYCEYAEFCRVS